jgi:hypothetical protein|tara:strand:- start:510 stop:944 length:435 start_codon:yes stop_codon:yes gene_type:complete
MKGRYKPTYPNKYKGDPTNIIYRSSWELKFMRFCDLRDDVIEWQSEEIIIPYRHPLDGKIHRYYPDFRLKVKNKTNNIENWIIEIKPDKFTKEPRPQQRRTRKYINEVKNYAINTYKWDAARYFCKKRNWKFKILTEKDLHIKG